MHLANRQWWQSVRLVYPHLFVGRQVLEVGSLNVNGTVRDFFAGGAYTGIDWRRGPGVDLVTLAHEMPFVDPFEVIVSASMLEHDPYWRQSLAMMVTYLGEHGALLLSWGGAENLPHYLHTAPDGRFHPLAAGLVLDELDVLGMYVERFLYEAQVCAEGTWECCGVVAFRHRRDGLGLELISSLRAADRSRAALLQTPERGPMT